MAKGRLQHAEFGKPWLERQGLSHSQLGTAFLGNRNFPQHLRLYFDQNKSGMLRNFFLVP